MQYLMMALSADFLLFILGVFWIPISKYIQHAIARCNQKLFSLITAIAVYVLIKAIFP